MPTDAVFDAASVTKVVVTTTAVLLLVERGDISLDDRIGTYLPELADAPIGQATLAQLLTHTSGLSWLPLFAWGVGWSDWLCAIADTPLAVAPGSRVEYSCIGFILLGRLVEVVAGCSLSEFAAREIFAPLGLQETFFLPLSAPLPVGLASRLVMTERRDASVRGQMLEAAVERQGRFLEAWRARHLEGYARGVVHDENAACMGGVAGNAGLFTTATDLLSFGQMYLDRGRRGAAQFLSEATTVAATRDWTGGPLNRGLGWQLAGPAGTFGDLASPQAYGHTGFTGALLFIDPSCSVVVVLLTNRLQFGRSNERILRVRRLFLNSVLAAVR
jgi:CubicO group peptidase (beta-lactamase class C family)